MKKNKTKTTDSTNWEKIFKLGDKINKGLKMTEKEIMTNPTKKESFGKAQDKWEKEFDKIFQKNKAMSELKQQYDGYFLICEPEERVKSFIRQTIDQEVKEALRRIKMPETKIPKKLPQDETRFRFEGWNEAIYIINQNIKKELKEEK